MEFTPVRGAEGTSSQHPDRWRCLTGLILLLACGAIGLAAPAHAQNAIVTENALTGNPASEWDISGAGDLTIQGFATQISVNFQVAGGDRWFVESGQDGFYRQSGCLD